MKRTGFLKKALVFFLAVILGITPAMSPLGTLTAHAMQSGGSYSFADSKDEVVGTWSYDTDNGTVTETNVSLLDDLPYVGSSSRYTTDNYDANYGAFDTSNWASSFMWDLGNDNPYSNSVYAIPLAFRAGVDGGAGNVMQITAPSTLSDTTNNYYNMQMPANGSLTDFYIQTSFDVSSAKVDAITDWTYDIVMENAADTTQYLKTTMVQGSIFAYFQLIGDTTLTISRGKSLPAAVAYTSDSGNVIVIRCYDNMDGDYDYYAFYGATGTTFDVTTSGSQISSIAVEFTGTDKAYMTVAYLGSTPSSPDDAWGANMCQAYLPYAYNFVTDTRASYSYNEETSTLSTTYTYTVDKKAESTADGTIMGVLPHQYKNMSSNTAFLSYTYHTVRGVMKTIAGSSFSTKLTYSGILPFMPDYTQDVTDAGAEDTALDAYLQDYLDDFGGNYFSNYDGIGDTYWDGKGLNRLANALTVAEITGHEKADDMYEALKSRLEEWFTYSGADDTTYFYYDKDLGAMFGFPQSYSAVDQINDHHFHYGYFIYAAAQVALRDESGEWAEAYGGMVEELIDDIACTTRNSASSRYPYLRNFAPYEGHSWASGHANFELGNNQESSSEALNAWAGIILWGEATGNDAIRDLGIYLYTTEISAVQNYWYDVEENVLSDAYRYGTSVSDIDTIDKSTAEVKNNSAAIVWGGAYCYATWFSANPLHIQGINLLPMNPTCFYLAGDADYIAENYDLAYEKAEAGGYAMEEWIDIWLQYYAMAYPDEALTTWQSEESEADSYGVEGGDTKAHTYHFIKSLCTYGTPDTSISSDSIFSTVFVKDGVKTYCAYNADSAEKTIHFSDGYSVKVPANSMSVQTEGESEDQAKYNVEYYVENTDGTYVLDHTENKYAAVNDVIEITAETAKALDGYVFDSTNANNVLQATVKKDTVVAIKLYYNREEYTITYELNGGTNAQSNPSTYKYKDSFIFAEPVKEGCRFDGWFSDAALSTEVTEITAKDMGDITLYAGWSDPYVYELDATKKVTYEDGKLTVSVSGLGDTATVLVYCGYYTNEADAESLTSDTGVAGLGGHDLAYNSETGLWEVTFDSGFSAGQFMVFRINVIQGGVGDLSAWGLYEIPDGSGSSSGGSEEDEKETAAYKVEHYKQDAEGSASYTLADTDDLSGTVGETVTAVEKTYEGYKQNQAHADRVASGIILSDGGLVLKLYYDIAEGSTSGGEYPTPANGGYTYDAETTYVTFSFSKNTTVYVAKYDSEAAAVTAAYNANNVTSGDGLNQLSGVVGYPVSVEGSDGTYTTDSVLHNIKMSEGQYFVYGFVTTGIEEWYVGVAKATAGGGEVTPVSVDYVIEHYQQNTDLLTYTKVGSTEGSGEAGDTITAEANSYTGFTANKNAEDAVLTGTLEEGKTLTLKVYYDRNKYSVTYEKMDGAVNAESNKEEYVYGIGLTFANPTKDGFDFAGWYTDAECNNPITVIGTDAAENITVYAKWIEIDNSISYTVKYYQQNTSFSGYDEVASITLFADPETTVEAVIETYKGFTHNPDVEGTVLNGTLEEGSNLVLKVFYDRNKYSVTYENMDGAVNAEANKSEYVYGVGLTFAEPSMEGYVFRGWYTDDECTNAVTGIGTDEAGDVTVYAKWEEGTPVSADYVVKYYIETLTEDRYMEVVADRVSKSATAGNAVEADIRTYEGFVLNKDAAGSKLSGILSTDEVLTLQVFYDREEYSITYENMENAVNAQANAASYVYGKGFSLETPTKEAAVFAGWYLDENFAEDSRVLMISDSQTGNVVLYAKWETVQTEYYVKYFLQDVSLEGYTELTEEKLRKTADHGAVISAIDKGYDKEFEGFSFNETKGVISGTADVDQTLTLELYYDRNKYNVTYANMDGAVNASENATQYVYGIGLKLAEPKKEDAAFTGWYLTSDFASGSEIVEITTGSTGDITVYAKWLTEDMVSDYTVQYYLQDTDLAGYTEEESARLTSRDEIGADVTAPVKEFTGFALNADAAGTITTGKLVQGEALVLKLYYDRLSYDIVYNNMENATNHASNKAFYVYGVETILKEPEKDGYLFGGWYTDAYFSEENKLEKISAGQTGKVILYAKWDLYVPEIEEEEIVDTDFTVETIKDQYYTGSKIVPTIVVKDGDKILTNKKDYTVKISKNINAGQAVVKITGKGNYNGTVEKQFTIHPADISADTFNADDIFTAYKNGKSIKVKPKLTWGKKTLKLGKDYKIDGDSAYSQAGTYTVKLTGINNYCGDREITFCITDQVLMSKVKISKIPNQYYKDGEAITPAVTVQYKGNILTEGTDYEVEYLNNNNAGTATVVVTGNGSTYVGVKQAVFKIIGTNLKSMPIELEDTEFEYTGSSILPGYYTGSLQAGKDYTVAYTKNVSVGKGTVTFTGMGEYSGTVKKTFKIRPYNITNNSEGLFEDRTGDIRVEYTKGGSKPLLTLYFGEKLLAEGTDYTLKYKGNAATGKATVTITGKGNFTGKIVKEFAVSENDMSSLIVMPEDIVAKTGKKASYYMAKFTVMDENGKKLAAKKDYDHSKTVYEYTVDGVTKQFDKNSKIGDLPVGTVLRVTITGINGYKGTVSEEYRVVGASIKSAKFQIPAQTYTGEAVNLTENDIKLTIKNQPVTFEIVEGSYINNIKKGTAKVTLHGTGEYGGYKTVSFKIGQKSIMDAIAGIFGK